MFGFDKYARIIKIQAKLVEHGLDEILLTKSWMRIVLFLFRLHPSTRKKTDKEFQVGESINDLKGTLCGNGKGEWHYPAHTGKVLFISSFATW